MEIIYRGRDCPFSKKAKDINNNWLLYIIFFHHPSYCSPLSSVSATIICFHVTSKCPTPVAHFCHCFPSISFPSPSLYYPCTSVSFPLHWQEGEMTADPQSLLRLWIGNFLSVSLAVANRQPRSIHSDTSIALNIQPFHLLLRILFIHRFPILTQGAHIQSLLGRAWQCFISLSLGIRSPLRLNGDLSGSVMRRGRKKKKKDTGRRDTAEELRRNKCAEWNVYNNGREAMTESDREKSD